MNTEKQVVESKVEESVSFGAEFLEKVQVSVYGCDCLDWVSPDLQDRLFYLRKYGVEL